MCLMAQVYDGTPFLKDHPGGADSIMLAAGQDASDEFDAIHSTKAKAMLEDYYIGELAADTAGADNKHPRHATKPEANDACPAMWWCFDMMLQPTLSWYIDPVREAQMLHMSRGPTATSGNAAFIRCVRSNRLSTFSCHADGAVMPGAEVLAVPTTVPAAALATPASLRADSGVMAELIALDPRKRQKFQLVSKEVLTSSAERYFVFMRSALLCPAARLPARQQEQFLHWQASSEEGCTRHKF